MTILIEDQATEQLIQTLARRTGESIDEAVKQAVRERLRDLPLSEAEIAARKGKLAEPNAKWDAMPKANDDRTANEIIGYDENGLST